MELTFEQISAGYRGSTVIENISFRVPGGSITALTGRNGAGKSTLISCLMGQLPGYRGRILLDGEGVGAMEPMHRAKKVACLPQVLPNPHVTVRELAAFGRTPYLPFSGKLRPEDEEKVQWALRSAGMEVLQDCFVDRLSGGQRKKAFFAMVLAQDTPLVVLDEPTAHLDAASRFEFLDLIERLKQETGKSFLVVIHELPEILRYADRIVTLSDKRLVFQGTPEQCLAQQIPQKYFGIRISGSKAEGYAALPNTEPTDPA